MSSRLLLLIICLVPSLAAAQAGRFILAVGDVVVVRGAAETRAGIGTAVESGDTIRVGVNSNAQVRMSDESILGLRPGTVLRLDEYAYSGSVDGKERSIFSLLKGGFRTVTGAIGRLQSKERYAVRTSTATVGIRGTHYTLVLCDNDCDATAKPSASGGQTSPGGGVANGLYGGVSDGRISAENATGERLFGANEYFYVASQNTAPQSLIAPPSFLYDRLSGQSRNQGQKGQETSENMAQSGMNAESRPSEVPAPPAPNAFIVTEQRTTTGQTVVVTAKPDTGAVGSWQNPAFASFNDGGSAGGAFIQQSNLKFDANGKFVGFDVPPGCVGPNDGCAGGAKATLATSTSPVGPVLDQATIPNSTSTIFWGRWAAGTLTEEGGTFTITGTNWAHFMYGPLTPAETIAAKTATSVLYSSINGTVATNNFGELAISGSFPTITMNFTARTATFSSSSFSFSGANPQSWSLSGGTTDIKIVAGQGAGFFGSTTGSCSGTGCGGTSTANAKAAGLFLGPTGDHAGVAYSGTAGGGAFFNTVRVYTCSGQPSC
jgi:hypothetical protein